MIEGFEKIKSKEIKELVYRQEEFDFPCFLTLLRRSIGVNRRSLAKETKLPEWRLFNYEKGRFSKDLNPYSLLTLADYYGIPFRILESKMKSYRRKKELMTE